MRARGKFQRRWALALCLCGLALCADEAGAKPPRPPWVQTEGAAVWADDAVSLQRRAVRRGRAAWLVCLSRAWYAVPPMRACTVYLRPTVRTARLRRGEALRGLRYEEPRRNVGWDLGKDPHRYAQVALPGEHFGAALEPPGPWDAPFGVAGAIADADLIAVADYVRAKERPPNETRSRVIESHPEKDADGNESISERIGPGPGIVHPELPIMGVHATDADHVEVTTGIGGSGERIKLRREAGQWLMEEVWQWVA